MVFEVKEKFLFPSKKFGALLPYYKDSLTLAVSDTATTITIPDNQEWVIEDIIVVNGATAAAVQIKDNTTDVLTIPLAANEKFTATDLDIPVGNSLVLQTDTAGATATVNLVLKKVVNPEMV